MSSIVAKFHDRLRWAEREGYTPVRWLVNLETHQQLTSELLRFHHGPKKVTKLYGIPVIVTDTVKTFGLVTKESKYSMANTTYSFTNLFDNLLNSYNKAVARAVEDFDLDMILNHVCPDCKETYVITGTTVPSTDIYIFSLKCKCKVREFQISIVMACQNEYNSTELIQKIIDHLLTRIRNN